MAAYRDVLLAALSEYAPEIEAECIQLGQSSSAGRWRRRWHALTMPFAAWRKPAPDLWHILDGSRAYLAPSLRSAPVVITAHDVIPVLQAAGSFPGAPPVSRAARCLWQANAAAMRRVSTVVSVSASTANDVCRLFGVDQGNLPVVGLPVRPSLQQFADLGQNTQRDPEQILHVGNNSFYKWRDQAIRIFARLPERFRLTMVGPAPPPELSGIATSLGVEDRVRFIQSPTDPELARQYARASLLIFPSRYEGFGWPVLEAMSFALPVLASNRGSLPEVVGDASATIDPDDLDRFAARAQELLLDSSRWKLASEHALRQAQRFTMKGFAEAMSTQYQRLLAVPASTLSYRQ